MSTNSTRKQLLNVMNNLMVPYNDGLADAMESYLKFAQMKPSFALLSMPFGRVGLLLQKYNIDFAVNIPTILVPPLVPWAAPYVPIPFHHVSVHNMSFFDRIMVLGFNALVNFFRAAALSMDYKFTLVPEMGWDLWQGRLVFINSIPGMDYTQPLPPLVQYTGPVVDVKKMEPFPEDVEQWLEGVPADMPVVYVSFGTVAAMLASLTSPDFYTLWALPKPQQAGLPGNSATESMALGVPLIGYPQFGDQPAVCQRIADAGAGISGPPGGWVQTTDVLHVLQTERYAERAAAMSRLLEQFGGVSRAADLLELAVRGDLKLLETPLESSFTERFKYHATHHSQIVRLGRVQSSDTSKLRYKVLPIPPARLHLYILSV
ncbi:2-hydroxyacylsphingosine 1-beta-galactosyltransferase (Ceramide UDP-galactosyltransferase) (Cerebroside synthase) (UDP-galactose-ceramide galactosyltransferase) [Durusdinium trenchii]|uniref:2-hydroxyacylsphingosine 1-beta-galactosyltransferase (Ceramide UDP-galactosyltransferase) (Cerebroside synthase) (UDP-galactose-ceramide galactosyltransferase) n=1 Tax=Durusdinium trenchii TaxID=1381693 RepID=A0ABP0JKB2_9DINO